MEDKDHEQRYCVSSCDVTIVQLLRPIRELVAVLLIVIAARAAHPNSVIGKSSSLQRSTHYKTVLTTADFYHHSPSRRTPLPIAIHNLFQHALHPLGQARAAVARRATSSPHQLATAVVVLVGASTSSVVAGGVATLHQQQLCVLRCYRKLKRRNRADRHRRSHRKLCQGFGAGHLHMQPLRMAIERAGRSALVLAAAAAVVRHLGGCRSC